MRPTYNPDAVIQSVQEICDYYTSCSHLFGNSILISKAMLAYALQLNSVEQLEPILQQLQQQGAVLGISNDSISFTHGFSQGMA